MKILECDDCEFSEECYNGDMCGYNTCDRCGEVGLRVEGTLMLNGSTEDLCDACYKIARKNKEIIL